MQGIGLLTENVMRATFADMLLLVSL